MLTLTALAQWLETDEPTVLRLLRDGVLPRPISLGFPLVRWPEPLLDKWVAEGCHRASAMDPDEFKIMRDSLCLEAAERRHAARRQTK
jgi:predicted DNA-binding transcriptional regulator AlpA